MGDMPAVLSLPWLLLLAATAGRTNGHQFGNTEAQEGHQKETKGNLGHDP
jgi:hypothetical protein